MQISDAQAIVAGKPEDISELRESLAEIHAEVPQRAGLADLACRGIEDGLAQLRSLGHHFYLVEGDPPGGIEFPKMLYRDEPGSGALQSMTVENEGEQKIAVDNGWRFEQGRSEGEAVKAETLGELDSGQTNLDDPLDPASPPSELPPATETSVPPGSAATIGLPPQGAAGAGADNERGDDLRSISTDAQREQMTQSKEQVASDPTVAPPSV